MDSFAPQEEEDGLASLEIDENLSLLERIERYHRSQIPVQRQVYVKEIAYCAEQVGAAQSIGRLVPLLGEIAKDQELSVRQALAEQLVPLARVLFQDPDARGERLDGSTTATARECVLSELVPLLTSLLSSNGGQEMMGGGQTSSEAASEALLELAGMIDQADLGDTVLRSVLCLAHDNDNEENRVVATQLLGSLAPILGYDLCIQYVLSEFFCLADDPAFRVRKAAALRLGAVSTVVGQELSVQKLLPVIEMLAHDEIWGVRKASVESLPQVSEVMPPAVRSAQLEKLMHEFHADSSRWVRISACQALGPFIATLPAGDISPALLEQYTQLANPANPTATDADVAFNCAFNFPGVAQAVGAARWGEISDAFSTLANNIQWKVRRTLACALHELAAVLGPEMAERELLPTFDMLIKDLDEVKVGVIQSLAAFIGALTPETRLLYLPVLAEIRAETDNWRFRQLLSAQLAAFGAVYPKSATLETLLPLALSLCTDSVAQVRLAAIEQIGKLLLYVAPAYPPAVGDAVTHPLSPEGEALAEEEARTAKVAEYVDSIASLARAHTCYKRANCVQICTSLVEGLPSQMVIERILPLLRPLTSDRVANVRLALATLVKQRLLAPGGPFEHLDVTREMADALRHDADRDVLRTMHADEPGYEPPPYRCKPPPQQTPPVDLTPGDDGAGNSAAGPHADDDGGVAQNDGHNDHAEAREGSVTAGDEAEAATADDGGDPLGAMQSLRIG